MASFPTVRAGVSTPTLPQANADWQQAVSGLFGDYAQGQQYRQERDIQQGRQALLGQAGPNTDWNMVSQQLLGLGDIKGANIAADIAQTRENYAFRNQQAGTQNQQWQAEFDARERARNEERNMQPYRVDPATGAMEARPGGPADPRVIAQAAAAKGEGRAPRPLPSAAINNLSETGATATSLDNIAGGFKPEYAGQPVLGDMWNYVGRAGYAGSKDQAEWWQSYQSQKNVLRNKLFGSALTATEKGEFEKADINPGMSPEVIQKNLNRQREMAVSAARKIAAGYLKSGYPPEAVEGAIGIPLTELGVSADPNSTAARQNDYVPPQPAPGGGKNMDRAPQNQPVGTFRASAAPAGAIDALRQNPDLRDQFEAKYGPGSADRALGMR